MAHPDCQTCHGRGFMMHDMTQCLDCDVPTLRARLTAAEAIVRDLAACEPFDIDNDDGQTRCALCHARWSLPARHAETCPWRRAQLAGKEGGDADG